MVALNGFSQLSEIRVLEVVEAGANPDHEQLSDLLLDGHLAQGFFRPLLAARIETNGAGALVLILRLRGGESNDGKQGNEESAHQVTITKLEDKCLNWRRQISPHPTPTRQEPTP